MATKLQADPTPAKPKGIITRAEQFSNEFCCAGDHARHASVHELAVAAVAFKQTIAALRGKVPDELAADLATIDAAL